MKYTYTQRDIGKLLKKVIKKKIVDVLPMEMAKNCVYTKEDIVNTVLFSVLNNNFIEYGSKRLRSNGLTAPSSDTVFYHLNKLGKREVFSTFQRVDSEMLKQARRCGIFKKAAWGGLDIHKMPYFGKHKDRNVIGMERVRGTSYGYGYASIECVNTKEPFTLAALPLDQLTTKKEIITKLVNEARKHVKIDRLFLDRGFFNVESIEALIDLKVPFIIPAVRNKRIKRIISEAHIKSQKIPATKCYASITDYTMKKGKHSVTMKLVVILELKGNEWGEFAYVTNMNVALENALELANSYRSRWGIETGYRVKENVRGKTCSTHYATRLTVVIHNSLQSMATLQSHRKHKNKVGKEKTSDHP